MIFIARIKLILKDKTTEMRFPVTPSSYTVSYGRKIAVYDLTGLGEHTVYAGLQAQQYGFNGLLIPAGTPSYAMAGTMQSNTPNDYYTQLKKWMDDKTQLRLVVSGSAVKANLPVYLSAIKAYERDGTHDLYLDINLYDHRALSSATSSTKSSSPQRESKKTKSTDQKYTIKKGDTLWAICRSFYANGTLCYKLASYNKISNPNYIKVGTVILIPEKSKL